MRQMQQTEIYDEGKKSAPGSWKRLGYLVLLQAIVVLYTLAGVAGKFAAGYAFLSTGFILCYGAEIVILGVYAILWQQMLKRFDLSVAYANRAIAIIWSLLWAVVLFHESITVTNVIGALLVIAGTVIVNGAGKDTAQLAAPEPALDSAQDDGAKRIAVQEDGAGHD